MKLYLAMEEPEGLCPKVLGVFSTLELAKRRAETGKSGIPWQEVQGIGARWWNVGWGGGAEVIYEIDLDEAL